jgi:hypothetical protein
MNVKKLLDIPPWEWPADAGKILLKTLTNQQAPESDRLIAAELGSEIVVMDDAMAEALLAIVRSSGESKELRGRAAIGLGPVLEQADTELLGHDQQDEFEDPDAIPITLQTFRNLQDSLYQLYLDKTIPPDVRRRILEAAVRSPQTWHGGAIQAAYSSGDREWMLTAVFSMGYIGGFEEQIMEALESADPLIHLQAIRAAGTWEVAPAWDHIVAVLNDPETPKPLRLAAIEAVGKIRPNEALEILAELADSRDEDIAEAAEEAMMMAQAMLGGVDDEDEDEEDNGEWVN